MRFTFLILFSLMGATVTAQQYFTDADDLADAVNASIDGGAFVVADGSYNDFEASFEIIATESNPIIIKAETVGGVVLTGESHFVFKKSAYVTLEGFVFDGQGEDSLVKLEGCNNIRISRNVFELETSESIKWVFVGGVWNDNTYPFQYPSHHNRIDHYIFRNKATPGHYITIDGSFDDTGSEEAYYQSQYDLVDHNYFSTNGPRAINEQESIRIGWSEMSLSSGFTTVEHNLFEDCDGDPEIVSVKSCDNTIRHNTFLASYGTLSLRHGNRNRIEVNYFFGNEKEIGTSPGGSMTYTGGIRIYGTDHVIINNYMEGLNGTRWDAPITLTLGDAIDGQSSNLSKHFRAERVLIAYNTLVNNSHGIEIGYDNNDNYNKDLKDITIANNLITGSENSLVAIVDTDNDQGTQIAWKNNLFFPAGNANILSGASTTVFDSTSFQQENPNLVFDGTSNTWRTSTNTPLYETSIPTGIAVQDIDGQARPSLSNPGADHFSMESVRFMPLTSIDVGPNAYDGTSSTTTFPHELSETLVYPVPAKQKLQLQSQSSTIRKIEVVSLGGSIVLSYSFNDGVHDATIDSSSLSQGIYMVCITKSDNLIESKKIIVQN